MSKRIIRWFAIPLSIVGVYFLSYYQKPYYLINPDMIKQEQVHPIETSSDRIDHGGNTRLQVVENKANRLIFNYTLQEGHRFLYASVALASDSTSPFDFSSYDHMRLSIKSKKGTRLQIMVLGDENVVKEGKDSLRYTMRQHVINVSDQETLINMALNEFYIPEWWHFVHNTQEGNYSKPAFNRVYRIAIGNCINLKPNTEDRIEVSTLMLYRSLSTFYYRSALFLCFYYFVLGIRQYFIYKKKQKTLYFHPEDKGDASLLAPEEVNVFDYITQHYMKDLSISDLAKQTGIPESRISTLVKEKTGLKFKTFLAQLRIAEAKRLLQTSDLQISEIAFQVGFGNVSHFNRVFKNEEQCSPNEYRRQYKI